MVQEAIAQFDLTELANQPIHNLSLGQKKRVSIADIMVLKPKLLLLDEPTAYLDPRHTRKLIGLLQQIHATGPSRCAERPCESLRHAPRAILVRNNNPGSGPTRMNSARRAPEPPATRSRP